MLRDELAKKAALVNDKTNKVIIKLSKEIRDMIIKFICISYILSSISMSLTLFI